MNLPVANKTVDRGKLFPLIYEKQVILLEHQHFVTFSELLDLGSEREWLLTSQLGKE